MNTQKEKPQINFWGLKFSCEIITTKLLLLVGLLLTFFVVVVVLLKAYVLPILLTLGSKKVTTTLGIQAKALLTMLKRGSP